MELEVRKTCSTCCKSNVCKYQKERMNIEYDLQNKVISGVYDKEDYPFRLESSCGEWDNRVKERGDKYFK